MQVIFWQYTTVCFACTIKKLKKKSFKADAVEVAETRALLCHS